MPDPMPAPAPTSVDKLLVFKLAIVAVVVVGGFALVVVGKLDSSAMFKDVADLVTGLVIALGITSAGVAMGGGQIKAARLMMRLPPEPERPTDDVHGRGPR